MLVVLAMGSHRSCGRGLVVTPSGTSSTALLLHQHGGRGRRIAPVQHAVVVHVVTGMQETVVVVLQQMGVIVQLVVVQHHLAR